MHALNPIYSGKNPNPAPNFYPIYNNWFSSERVNLYYVPFDRVSLHTIHGKVRQINYSDG